MKLAACIVTLLCLCAATPATTTDPVMSSTGSIGGAHPSWNGDFSTGDWSQYNSYVDSHMDGVWPRDFAIVRNPAPPGFEYAARYTVGRSSVVPGEAGQRALDALWPGGADPASGSSRAYQGADTWYRDALYVPSSFRAAPNQDWNSVYELHNWPDTAGDANVNCAIVTTRGAADPWHDGGSSAERLSCRISGGGSPAHPIDGYGSSTWPENPDTRWTWFVGLDPVPRDRWIDLVWHIAWSWTAGRATWWVDGVKRGSWKGPTLFYYADDGTGHGAGPGQAYLTHGYYRPGDGTGTAEVYHGATMVGPTAESVGKLLP
jgi:hypothetical protein